MNSGLYYTNPYANQYAAANLQYGVNMPAVDPSASVAPSASFGSEVSAGSEAFGIGSSLAAGLPFVGPFVSTLLNYAGQAYQNYKQEQFYNDYMSPAARMAQMRAAGINPNAAAQGISGSSAPQMNAAAPSSAGNAIGEQLGNSANTALTAEAIRAGIRNTDADTNLKDSFNTEKTITNSFLTKQQQVALEKLVADGEISRSMANMFKVDEAWKPSMAEASYNQLMTNIKSVEKQIELMDSQIVHEYAAAYQSMMNGNLAEAQIHKVFSDIGLNNAMIERIQHEIPNIDANTAATYQSISESQARTVALNIQNKFQQEYYDLWKNTGFNFNSSIEQNIVSCFANMQPDEARRMMSGVQYYVQAVGDARVGGMDYVYDKIFGLLGDFGKFCGMAYVGGQVGGRTTTNYVRDPVGNQWVPTGASVTTTTP